ncbi:unnamed protein product [Closterium sp. NIES-54]
MASLRILPFYPEGRPVAFDTWHDDLQLYLLSDSQDSVSLFDHVSGAAPAPPATADLSIRSQWLSRDATARLAIRNHLPATECAHFGEHRTAQALYDTVVARHSSPATAAIGRLLLPYLFPKLSAFARVADLVTHLRTSDARYRATVPSEFLPTNQPPMFITLYFKVSRLPDSLRCVRDHFLTLDPTSLTIDLLEQHLLTAETNAVVVGAARGTLRSPFFEGCSPSPLSSSFISAAAADVSGPEDVSAASTSTKRHNSKGKGGRGSGGGSGGGGGGSGSGSGGSGRGGRGGGGGGGGGTGGGGGGSGGSGGGSGGSGGNGGGGTSGGQSGPQRGGPGGGQGQRQQRRSETQMPQQLREWLVQRGAGEGSETCPYVIRTGARAGRTCGRFHTERRCIARLDDAWHTEFSAAALGASASGTHPETAPAEALHTFTLHSGASRCFFRDSTTLTPLRAPVPVTLANPSGGPVVASSSTALQCPAVPSGSLSGLHLPSFYTNLVSTNALQDAMVTTTTPGGQRVSICKCTWMGRHLATFTRRPGSSLYTPATEPPQVAASAQVSVSGQVAASCSCRLLSHHTLLWHHRVGHPSLPRLRGMHSFLLVSGLPRSLPPLPPSPAPLCRPCVEGRQRAAPHSSSFPPTTAPLQTLHMDVWGPAYVSGQGRERCILLVVDDYTQYTTVFPLRSKGEVSTVLIPWIRTVRLQLRERFGEDLPVLRLHSDRGGEFSSNLLRDFCRGEGILLSFTLLDSPQQNGIAEYRIGLVMEPRVSLPETSPTLCWTGKVGDASVFWVWGSRALVRDTSADKLSARAIPCDVTFDESVPFYRLFPYRSAPSPPPPLFLTPGPPPVDPLPAQGPAPSGVSQVDPLPGTALVQVAVVSGAAPGVAPRGAASGGAEPGGAGSEGAGSGGAGPRGVEPRGAESEGLDPGGAEWEDAESGGAEPQSAALSGSPGVGGAGAAGAGDVDPGADDPGAGGAGGPVRPRSYFVPLLQQVLCVPSSTGLPPPFLCPTPYQSQPSLQPASPLPIPSPYTEQSGGLTKRRTHTMALRPSSVPLRVPLPAPPESFLPEVPDPESDRVHGASPTVACLLATAVTDPSFESAAASGLVAELLDFAATCCLDYASALVPESVLLCDAIICIHVCLPPIICSGDYGSLLLSVAGSYGCRDGILEVHMHYVDEVPPPGVNIVDGMWIFRVKQPPGSPPAFKARYVARGFSQRQGVDYFQTFSPTPKMTTLWGSLYEEIWLRRPPGFTGSFPTGTQWSLRRLVYGLRQAPRKWHDTLRTTVAALGFVPSTADPSLFLRTDTSLPPFYNLVYVDDLVFATAVTYALTLVKSKLQKRHTCTDLGELRSYLGLQITLDTARCTITLTQSQIVHQVLQRFGFQYSSPQLTRLSTSHSLSAPPSDESIEPSGPYPELVGCLMYLMTCTRPDLAYTLSHLARYVAPSRHRKVHWDAAKRVLRYLCSTSGMGLTLGGRGPVVLTGHADASWVDDSAMQRSSHGYTFSLGSGSVSWRSTLSSSVLSSSCEAEIYAGAMAAQELRWLTYLLTELGEQPRSPPVLYIDNKAMIALCQEHRLER